MAYRKTQYTGNVRSYKGLTLVETGHNYYSACKGAIRIPVGSIKHGDHADLHRRFMVTVDRLETL